MLRIRLSAVFLVLATSFALAQTVSHPPEAQILTPYATMEKVKDGWLCRAVGASSPQLLGGLRSGDVLTSIDSVPLAGSSTIGMLQLLRTVEFDLAQTVEIKRAGATLQLGEPGSPQILASQSSFAVLRSSFPGVESGDVLDAIGEAHFNSMMAQVKNPLTSVVTIELRAGRVLKFLRNGQLCEITASRPATIRLLLFALDPTQTIPGEAKLAGLNTADYATKTLRGSWALLHFWATWCKPCMEHITDIRELSQRKDLAVLSIGFADTDERLAAMGTKEPALRVFAPSVELQREFAVVGIPFDLLLDPDGKAVLIVSGNMGAEEFKSTVLRYVLQ